MNERSLYAWLSYLFLTNNFPVKLSRPHSQGLSLFQSCVLHLFFKMRKSRLDCHISCRVSFHSLKVPLQLGPLSQKYPRNGGFVIKLVVGLHKKVHYCSICRFYFICIFLIPSRLVCYIVGKVAGILGCKSWA